MDLTAFVNPEAFYELPCHWNMQLADSCRPHLCKTTWNHGTDDPETPAPLVMHASGAGKQYGKWLSEKPSELAKDCEISFPFLPAIPLVGDFRQRYLYERSVAILYDAYKFRRAGVASKPFDLRQVGRFTIHAWLVIRL